MNTGRSLRFYRGLLLVLPPSFRLRNGPDLESMFAEALTQAKMANVPLFRFWREAITDLLVLAFTSRRDLFRKRGLRRALPGSSLQGPNPNKEPRLPQALIRDLWATFRALRKAPGFAFIAILTIGLGIGATTLVFSVVHGVLLKPLPYQNADRLVNVWNHLVAERQFLPVVHPADFRDYQVMSETFEDFAGATGAGPEVAGVLAEDGPPIHVAVSAVTHNFFSLLGIDPILGRHFTGDEEAPNGPSVAILSHELWTTRYGKDENIVGRSFQMDGRAFTVVGVLPRGFRLLLPAEAIFLEHSDVWVPLQLDYSELPTRDWTFLTVFGRMKPSVTLTQAQAEMDQIAEELRATHMEHARSGLQIHVVPLRQDIVKKARPALVATFGAVGFVLLIACANVAHLLLLRGTGRQRELAVRSALGASRKTIVRELFAECLVISSLGSALGLFLTWAGLQALLVLQPPNLPRLMELGISGPVWMFAASAAVLTAVVFGLAPAYHASKTDVTHLLRDGGRAGRSVGTMRIRHALVVAEVAFSLMLLVGTGLFLRSFRAMEDIRPGFDPEGALTFRISLPRNDYPGSPEVLNFYEELQTRLAGQPTVEAVGGVSKLPLTGSIGLVPYAYDDETAKNFSLTADGKVVTDDYFRAMGTKLVAGRFFSNLDNPESNPVVIVEEMLADRAWPNEDPIGQQLQIMSNDESITYCTVVGVVEHIRVYDLKQDVREHIYAAHGQFAMWDLSLVVRTSGDPMTVASTVREEVWSIDKNLPVDDLRPLQAYVADDMAGTSFTLMLMSVFGTLALLLASVGVYGVISCGVDQRSHEFGIRLALGANPRGLINTVMLGGLRLVAASIGVGLLTSLALARFIEGLLFEVPATDPATYAVVAAILACVALLACYVPARKTASADPMATLRTE